MKKPGRWCARCRTVHDEDCPLRPRSDWGKREGSGRGGRAYRNERKLTFERDNYLCQICLGNGVLTPVDLHGPNHGVCDHIVPLCKGGADTMENKQAICQSCNVIKTRHDRIN